MAKRGKHQGWWVVGLASWGGAGFLPYAPGTWGSLAALPLWWGLAQTGPWGYGAGFAVLLAAALMVSGPAQEQLGRLDHPAIVIDEVAGLLVTLAGVAPQWFPVAAGWFLFRVFDILKPWPIRWLSAGSGGLDVVVDDLAAGVMARLLLEVVLAFTGT